MGFNYGISIIASQNPEIVSRIHDGPTKEYYDEYNRLNLLLDSLTEDAAEFLKGKGYNAFPLNHNTVVEDEASWTTMLPYKTVATLAGAGWIGKCALLVTEKFGSAIRLTAVLTDAPLETGVPVKASKCGSCRVCTEACPGSAIKGINWSADSERDSFYDAFACRRTARARTAKIGIQASMCGLCMYSCPYTQKYLKKAIKQTTE